MGPRFLEISLLKYVTSWKYHIVAHGMDRNVDTKTTIDIIRCLEAKKRAMDFRVQTLFKGQPEYFYLENIIKKLSRSQKSREKVHIKDKNI